VATRNAERREVQAFAGVEKISKIVGASSDHPFDPRESGALGNDSMTYQAEGNTVVLTMSRETTAIKCVSLWQPWAEAMRRKWKRNETRSWWCGHTGWLAIHAAKKKFNPNDYEPAFAHEMRALDIWPDQLAYGAVVCIVWMKGCPRTEQIRRSLSGEELFWGNYEDRRYVWTTDLDRLIELPEAIPLRGRQGLFEWEPPPLILDRLNSGNPDYTPYQIGEK
jgi:hypothetical protein